MQDNQKKWDLWQFIRRLIQGMLIGTGAILPGISGGVLCASFGFYKPFMAILAHPMRNLKKYFRLLLPVCAGLLLGFWMLSGLISKFFTAAAVPATALFAGLILGTLPGLWKEAGEQGRTKPARVSMVLTFAVMLTFLLLMEHSTGLQLEATPGWMLFAGMLWGLSVVVPGMSSASVLILLGLYQPMAEGIARLDPHVVVPLGIGIALTVLVLARVVNGLFEKHYAFASHSVLGVVAASAVTILPRSYTPWTQGLLSLVCLAIGVAAALYMDKKGAEWKEETT